MYAIRSYYEHDRGIGHHVQRQMAGGSIPQRQAGVRRQAGRHDEREHRYPGGQDDAGHRQCAGQESYNFV